MKILHKNIRGLRSKKESLNNVINVVDPNMILLNEHGITKKNKVNIDGYITFSKNRNNKIMGGVSISTKKTEAQHVVKVKEGENDDEFILVRNEKYQPAINVLSIYGEQENRTSKVIVTEKWGRIL